MTPIQRAFNRNYLFYILLAISIIFSIIEVFRWELLGKITAHMTNYHLDFNSSISQSTKFSFYLLNLPFHNMYPIHCNKSRLIYKYLYQHHLRTFNISSANIIIPEWGYMNFKKWSYLKNIKCPFNPITDKSLYNTFSIIQYFYKLKQNHTILHNAWLFILFWPTDIANMDNVISNKDISFYQLESNMHPMFHFKRNIDIPAIPTMVIENNYYNNSIKNIKCKQRYTGNVTLFFQGHQQYTIYSSIAIDAYDIYNRNITKYDKYNLEPFNIITDCPRCDVKNGLQNNEYAKSKGIHISIESNSKFYKFPNEEYNEMLLQSHFCFVIPGRWQWTYRFFEVLSSGCIPVVICGGCVFPFEDFINWNATIIQIEQTFNWTDVDSLYQRLFDNNIFNNIYHRDLCKWHQHIYNVWETYFIDEIIQINWIIKELQFKWIKQNR